MMADEGTTVVQTVEVTKRPGQGLGLYIREGNGRDRPDGVFISRLAGGSVADQNGLLRVGDEILTVNSVDVTRRRLEDVVISMSIPKRLVLTVKTKFTPPVPPRSETTSSSSLSALAAAEVARTISSGGVSDIVEASSSSPPPPPIVVLKSGGRGAYLEQQRHACDISPAAHPEDISRRRSPDRTTLKAGHDSVLHYPSRSASADFHRLEELRGDGDVYFGGGYFYSAGDDSADSGLSSDNSGFSRSVDRPGAVGNLPTSPLDMLGVERAWNENAAVTRSWLQASSSSTNQVYNDVNQSSDFYTKNQHRSIAEHGGFVNDLAFGAARTSGRGPLSPELPEAAMNVNSDFGNRPYVVDYNNTIGPCSSSNFARFCDEAGGYNRLYMGGGGAGGMGERLQSFRYRELPRSRAKSTDRCSVPPCSRPPPVSRCSTSSAAECNFKNWLNKVDRVSFEHLSSRDLIHDSRMQSGVVRNSQIDHSFGSRITSEPVCYTPCSRAMTPGPPAVGQFVRSPTDYNQQTTGNYYGPNRYANNYHRYHPSVSCDQHCMSKQNDFRTSTMTPSMTARLIPSNNNGNSNNNNLSTPNKAGYRSATLTRSRRQRSSSVEPVEMVEAMESLQTFRISGSRRPLQIRKEAFLLYRSSEFIGNGNAGTGARDEKEATPNSASGGSGSLVGNGVAFGGRLLVHIFSGHGLLNQTTLRGPPQNRHMSRGVAAGAAAQSRDMYCTLSADAVGGVLARTTALTGDSSFDWDERFEVDVYKSRNLSVNVCAWDAYNDRDRPCYSSSLDLATLLRPGSNGAQGHHRLAIEMKPAGMLYVELTYRQPSVVFQRTPSVHADALFGADLEAIVRREDNDYSVPTLLLRCVEEVEMKGGMDQPGLYRTRASSSEVRELRAELERDVNSTDLSQRSISDVHVITAVIKDFLDELPDPLCTDRLLPMFVDTLSVQVPGDSEGNAQLMLSVIACLPQVNRVTLTFLLDHLKRVTSLSDVNEMSSKDVAICLGPTLFCPSPRSHQPVKLQQHQQQDMQLLPPTPLSLSKYIQLLQYILDIWPKPCEGMSQVNQPSSLSSRTQSFAVDRPLSWSPAN